EFETLRPEVRELAVDARESPSGLAEALDEADGHRIRPDVEHDRDALRRPLGGESDRGCERVDQVNLLLFETPRRRIHRRQIAFGVAHVEDELPSLPESQLPESVPQPVDDRVVRPSLEDDSYAIDARLLRLDGERRGEETHAHGAEKSA